MTKRRRSKERFAMLPKRVLEAGACQSLKHGEFRVLVAYAAAYSGGNNGSLALTADQAKVYGIGKSLLYQAQYSLQERGLLRMTRRGSRTPPVPHLFALTWVGIDPGKHDVRPNVVPSRDFERWPEKTEFDGRKSVTAPDREPVTEPRSEPSTVTENQSRSAVFDDRKSVTSKNLPYGKRKTERHVDRLSIEQRLCFNLHERGCSTAEIAAKTRRTPEDVERLIAEALSA